MDFSYVAEDIHLNGNKNWLTMLIDSYYLDGYEKLYCKQEC